MKDRSRDITIRLTRNRVVHHDCPSKYLFLTARFGIAEAANMLGITITSVYHHLRKNNESELVGIKIRKNNENNTPKNSEKQMYNIGGWFTTNPNIREELRQFRLNRVHQCDVAKYYGVSVGTIRKAAEKFGLLPWLWSTSTRA